MHKENWIFLLKINFINIYDQIEIITSKEIAQRPKCWG